jgi:hypothetical protein
VRYFGAIAFTFFRNSTIFSSSSLGGGVLRVGTGTPSSKKNSSFPAGELVGELLLGSSRVCVCFNVNLDIDIGCC